MPALRTVVWTVAESFSSFGSIVDARTNAWFTIEPPPDVTVIENVNVAVAPDASVPSLATAAPESKTDGVTSEPCEVVALTK